MSGPLPAHNIKESIAHEERGTTIVNAGGLALDYGDEAVMPLAETIATLQELLERIPPEYRATAAISFKAYGDYASLGGGDVSYVRPETDAELADRRRWLKSINDEREERERREFARLSQKYISP